MSNLTGLQTPAEVFATRRVRDTSPLVAIALLAVVVLSPLPFGSVMTWAWAPLAVVTALILTVWTVLALSGRVAFAKPTGWVQVAALLFGIVLLWILIQAAPFTPRSWHHPIWLEASKALGGTYSGRITLDPGETMTVFVRLLWYASIFWLALQMGRDSSYVRTSLRLVVWTGLAYSAYGLLVKFTDWEMVLWVKKFVYQTDVTGTFINKNSFAAYAGMCLICVTALLIDGMVTISAEEANKAGKLAAVVNELIGRNWYLILAWVVILSSIIMSNSRAGLVCSVIGVLALIVALSFSKSVSPRVGRWFGGLVIVAIAGIFLFSGDTIQRSFKYVGEQTHSRAAIYETTLEMIRDAPVLGMGLGTYPQVFQIYRKSGEQNSVPARKAHNTYLENAAELGVPAAFILVAALGLVFLMCVKGVANRRRNVVLPAIGIGATVLLGLHSVVDFSLQIPGITASYAFLLGLACAQSESTGRQRRRRRTTESRSS